MSIRESIQRELDTIDRAVKELQTIIGRAGTDDGYDGNDVPQYVESLIAEVANPNDDYVPGFVVGLENLAYVIRNGYKKH